MEIQSTPLGVAPMMHVGTNLAKINKLMKYTSLEF
jgi:hypothetical protein